jgi:CDP-diacylglycerol--serine O-phosphatidyltransferase
MTSKIVFIPSFFTFLNLFCGYISILKAFENNLHASAWFIILAVICDGMDGKLARWTASKSKFGFELDSLADLVSFGVSPAVLLYLGMFNRLGFSGYLLSFLFLFAGGYRLARFNVQQAGDRSHGYVGLPIPVAAIVVASLWLFQEIIGETVSIGLWAFLFFFLSIIMISAVSYDWPKLEFGRSWKKNIKSIVLIFSVVFMAVYPEICLFPLFVVYIFLGIGNWITALLKKEISWINFFMSVKRN